MGKILVTGGNGFVGNHIVNYLTSKDYKLFSPSSSELNVTNDEDWSKWEDRGIEHVIHLAGKTFVPDSWEHPEDFILTNAIGTLQAVTFCRKQSIGMTYISAYIYGQPKSNPISEMAEINPNNPYAVSKYMGEEICAFFGKYFDMDITTLRLFNVYGKGQSTRFLIPMIINQVLDKQSNITVQDLAPKRDYIHIDDVCRAVECSMSRTKGYNVFNIGSGVSYSVREIIEMVQKAAHTNKKVESKQNVRRNEINDVVADIEKIEKQWGWKPQVSMEKGIEYCLESEK